MITQAKDNNKLEYSLSTFAIVFSNMYHVTFKHAYYRRHTLASFPKLLC